MLIDAHAHLDRYESQLESALNEINRHKIFTISNSMDLHSYSRNLEIARKCRFVLPAFGIHPWHADSYCERLDELEKPTSESIIIGEIGLDYHFIDDETRYPAQWKVFEFFLKKAKERNKLINVRTKEAEQDVLNLLDIYGIEKAIIHWYSGPLDILGDMVDKGYYFTIGVDVLFSDHIKEIARILPSEQLLTETDNPGGYNWLAGKPGMPGILNNVIKEAADIRGASVDNIINVVERNFKRLIADNNKLKEVFEKACK
ncbi:MAG: TatD family hydrolase [candidate division Zixibacteria bacterium]|nr:TatD family hydrolase [candidate division Zixibacteria bacterium]